MSGIFFTSPLFKSSSNGPGWTHVDAYFRETQVFANVLLSAYRTQAPERFASFQPNWAEAWIVTPQTPTTTIAGISIPTVRDNTVYLKTNRLTFWLQVSNGGSGNPPTSASAVGVIYDTAPAAAFALESAVQQLNLAIFAEDGTVVGTHRSFRLEGGPEFDEDETRERVLAEALVLSGRGRGSLSVTTFVDDELPTNADFRINPSTRGAERLDPPAQPEPACADLTLTDRQPPRPTQTPRRFLHRLPPRQRARAGRRWGPTARS